MMTRLLRIVARVWSLMSIGFILIIFIGEAFAADGVRPTTDEWLGLALFPLGVLVGLLLAWWREGIGGALALLSLAAFYIWNWFHSGSFPDGPFFFLLAAPGLLFFIYWLVDRTKRPA